MTGAPAELHDHKAEQRDKLGRMADQIASFFQSYPEAEAVPAIAEHINQFWSRRMREDFLAGFGPDSQEIQPLVRRALSAIRAPRNV